MSSPPRAPDDPSTNPRRCAARTRAATRSCHRTESSPRPDQPAAAPPPRPASTGRQPQEAPSRSAPHRSASPAGASARPRRKSAGGRQRRPAHLPADPGSPGRKPSSVHAPYTCCRGPLRDNLSERKTPAIPLYLRPPSVARLGIASHAERYPGSPSLLASSECARRQEPLALTIERTLSSGSLRSSCKMLSGTVLF
jgi:hypothetical protein